MITRSEAIVRIINEDDPDRRIVIRACGTDNVLVELGEITLDLNYRARIYWIEKTLREMNLDGLIDVSPGVRSFLITFDALKLSLEKLIEIVIIAERESRNNELKPIPSRRVYMPIAFHDQKCLSYIRRYMETVRPEAPYLPDNMEFVARCNGLSGIEEVQEYFLKTEYMVLGLGDVYLGAPCAVPLDPRYRMNAPKYNPARTLTPEGAVGIGGAFICIYPMESPGGYQLIGRTVPFWNTWQTNDAFKEAPWLLRPFDRVNFEPVTEEELDRLAKGVHSNQYKFRIEEGIFDIAQYNEHLKEIKEETDRFVKQQTECLEIATKGY